MAMLTRCIVTILFFASVLSCSSLSLEDSSASWASKGTIEKVRQRLLPGIWKLSSSALPYEPDIRSKLTKTFLCNDAEPSNEENMDEILLKLNEDGTFRQCDEGYREGRWVTGRWKLQWSGAEESRNTREDCDNGQILLVLAMNRQYFGPQYDVVLEAKCLPILPNASDSDEDCDRTKAKVLQESMRLWNGTVKKGKFFRPTPGMHPFDAHEESGMQKIGIKELLEDPEPLGKFSLEQALTETSITGMRSQQGATSRGINNNDSQPTTNENEHAMGNHDLGGDDTFFLPDSSTDGGFLQ